MKTQKLNFREAITETSRMETNEKKNTNTTLRILNMSEETIDGFQRYA